jgi:hypothetical protein
LVPGPRAFRAHDPRIDELTDTERDLPRPLLRPAPGDERTREFLERIAGEVREVWPPE